MLYLWIVIGGWVYAVGATLCYRRLSRKFGGWHKGWRIFAALVWPAWSLFWLVSHSITKSVDGIEKILEGVAPTHRPSRNLEAKNIPD